MESSVLSLRFRHLVIVTSLDRCASLLVILIFLAMMISTFRHDEHTPGTLQGWE